MAYDFKSEVEVKEFIKNLGIEYRFGCFSEKKPDVCHLLADYLEAIDKDFVRARKIYQTTCDDYQYGHSCRKYATYALLGKGDKQPNYKIGYDYFAKGCNFNDIDSCLHQGLLLVGKNQQLGLVQDVSKGMKLLEKACDHENSNACYYLSGMYISGVEKSEKNQQQLVEKNMKKAFELAEKGCHLGNIYCCVNLSQMYSKGDGVEKNMENAEKYKKIAIEMQEQIESNQTLKFQQGLD